MEELWLNLLQLLMALPFFCVLLLSLLLGKYFYDWTTRFSIDDQLTDKDNQAFGVHFGLYLVAVAIAIAGSFHRGIFFDWLGFFIVIGSCIVSILLLRASIWINDRLLLDRYNAETEMIQDRNAGTGFVVGGACVAAGLIINGSLGTELGSEDIGVRISEALLRTFVFFAIGQIILVVGSHLFQAFVPYSIFKTIADDNNVAAGIAFGGFLAALGLIVQSSIVGRSFDYLIAIPTTLIVGALGVALLLVSRFFADTFLLPQRPLSAEIVEEKNVAAGAVLACCYLGVAAVFNVAFRWGLNAIPIMAE